MKNIKILTIGFLLSICILLIMGQSKSQLDIQLDSLKIVNLMNIEQEYRAKQNQLLEDITLDYERAVQARLDQAKSTEERLFKLIQTGRIAEDNGKYQLSTSMMNNIYIYETIINTQTGEVISRQKKHVKYYE